MDILKKVTKTMSLGTRYVLHAFFFFSRIPVGRFMVLDEKLLITSRILAPLVGLVIGILAAFVFIISVSLFGVSIAIVLSLLGAVLLTGGFHEDALADSIDAFGAGGHSSKDIITIMKDSRIGTYGTLALLFSFALSFFSLVALPVIVIPLIIIFAHTASRFAALPLMFWLSYVRHDSVFEKATKKHEKDMHLNGIIIMFLFVSLIGFLLFDLYSILFLFIIILVSAVTGWYYHKRLGGVTGDCFGATIKIAEVCIYLGAVVVYGV